MKSIHSLFSWAIFWAVALALFLGLMWWSGKVYGQERDYQVWPERPAIEYPDSNVNYYLDFHRISISVEYPCHYEYLIIPAKSGVTTEMEWEFMAFGFYQLGENGDVFVFRKKVCE